MDDGVKNKMTISEYVTKPASAWPARSIPIDEIEGDMDSLRSKIQSGRAYLRVVAYPWGVEFEVCEPGDGR